MSLRLRNLLRPSRSLLVPSPLARSHSRVTFSSKSSAPQSVVGNFRRGAPRGDRLQPRLGERHTNMSVIGAAGAAGRGVGACGGRRTPRAPGIRPKVPKCLASQQRVRAAVSRAAPRAPVARRTGAPLLPGRGVSVGVVARGLPDDVDWGQVQGYVYATVVQFGLIACTLRALDFAFPKLLGVLGNVNSALPAKAEGVAVFLFFLFMAFRSRIFSPLDNRRPTLKGESKEIAERKRPGWMPPPIAFPIIWSTIGILRATSSLLVWKALGGKFLVWPLMVFLFHLCIGDTWNSINNVDKEYGVASESFPPPFTTLLSSPLTLAPPLPSPGSPLHGVCRGLRVLRLLLLLAGFSEGRNDLGTLLRMDLHRLLPRVQHLEAQRQAAPLPREKVKVIKTSRTPHITSPALTNYSI